MGSAMACQRLSSWEDRTESCTSCERLPYAERSGVECGSSCGMESASGYSYIVAAYAVKTVTNYRICHIPGGWDHLGYFEFVSDEEFLHCMWCIPKVRVQSDRVLLLESRPPTDSGKTIQWLCLGTWLCMEVPKKETQYGDLIDTVNSQ
jgi:hypothetical protein